jgi:hypothetical protein
MARWRDGDGGGEVVGELVVSGVDTPPVLEPANGTFDAVAQLVELGVEGMRVLSGRILGMTGKVPRAIRKLRRPLLS